MMNVMVVTVWNQHPNRNVAKVVDDYEGEWSDATGQGDTNVIPAPNVVQFWGVVEDAVFAQIEADALLGLVDSPVILWSEEVVTDGE